MGLCRDNQGALSPLLPGSPVESCPAQKGPCQLAPTPATPPPPGELQMLPARATGSPPSQGDAYPESRVTAMCLPPPQAPDRQTLCLGSRVRVTQVLHKTAGHCESSP